MAKIAAEVGNINKGKDYGSKGSNANPRYTEIAWISGEVPLWKRERNIMKRVSLRLTTVNRVLTLLQKP